MDMSSPWLSDLEVENDEFINHYPMNNLYESVDDFSVDSFSSESYTEDQSFNQSIDTATNFEDKQPDIKLQPDVKASSSSYKKETPNLKPQQKKPLAPSNAFTLCFGDSNEKDDIIQYRDLLGYPPAATRKVSATRNTLQAQDHVLAERKRRERLTQRFISLSSLLPNLKKMDKASVLEDASNYIKELEGRVKELERLSGVKRKDEQQSVISVKRSRLSGSDADASSSEVSSNPCESSPEVEIQMSESNVLVKINCQKSSSSLMKALSEMQKLGLSVISSSAMPFANTTLLITIVAQMEDDFFMTATDLVKSLQLAMSSIP